KMEARVSEKFSVQYELDILRKKISVNGEEEEDLKEFLEELRNSNDYMSKLFYNNVIENAITKMRVLGWSGLDIKEWLNSVGYTHEGR
ncbi:MAG: hypothetical protein ACK4R7_05620, partial [Fervidobacterium sp.]